MKSVFSKLEVVSCLGFSFANCWVVWICAAAVGRWAVCAAGWLHHLVVHHVHHVVHLAVHHVVRGPVGSLCSWMAAVCWPISQLIENIWQFFIQLDDEMFDLDQAF